jgi:hypothetical protein
MCQVAVVLEGDPVLRPGEVEPEDLPAVTVVERPVDLRCRKPDVHEVEEHPALRRGLRSSRPEFEQTGGTSAPTRIRAAGELVADPAT